MAKKVQYNPSWYDTTTRVFTKLPDQRAPVVTDNNDNFYLLDIVDGKLSLRLIDETTISSIPSGNLPTGYISGGKLNYVSASRVSIGTAGQTSAVRSFDDTFDISWSGALTIDITTTGIGGLRAGLAEGADTWYAVFAIGSTENLTTGTTNGVLANKLIDTTKTFTAGGLDVRVGDLVVNTDNNTTALVTAIDSATQLAIDTDIFLHVSSLGVGEGYRIIRNAAGFLDTSTTPTLPTGFNKYRRLGWVRNDSGSNFIKFDQFGNDMTRQILYDVDNGDTEVLTNGNAIAFTDVDCSAFIPSTSLLGIFHVDFDPQTGNNDARIRPDGSTVATPLYQITSGSGKDASFSSQIPVSSSQIIEYEVDQALDDLDIKVQGYCDEL